eukprot:gene16659-34673_t
MSPPAYAPVDAADEGPWRPDLAILLYPVATMRDPFVHAGSRGRLLGAAPTRDQIDQWSLEALDWSGGPPTFLLHALDDGPVPVDNSLMLLGALRTAGVPVEAHLFQEGGHGFGVRLIAGRPAQVWPELVLAFGRRHGWGPRISPGALLRWLPRFALPEPGSCAQAARLREPRVSALTV